MNNSYENPLLSVILDVDSYKLSHWLQYPPNTTYMFSYFESRGGKFNKTLFFGLQYYLKRFLSKPITKENVEEAKEFAQLHGEPFNYDGWMRIVNKFGGFIPVIIKAVPEGSVIPTHNILFSIESTDPKTFWVVSWLETMFVRLWYPITVATESYYIKQTIKYYLDKTSDNTDAEINFKLHDFGSRGVSSQESASIGGAAHLVNFMGSDTIAGIYLANKYYNEIMTGFSIPAAEHSTISMWGKHGELEAYRNMIDVYGNTNIFACVSDTWDIYNAAYNFWGDKLKNEVMKMKATLVIRPDSGDPTEVILNLLAILDNKFGSTLNLKGYKVLNKVRLIQGDGIDANDVDKILDAVEKKGFSATNIAFGMGGGLLQKCNRDTLKFAFKCSAAKIDEEIIDVYKEPVTDKGKKSKRGILLLNVNKNNEVFTSTDIYNDCENLMRTVYYNGKILVEDNFNEIRNRTNIEYRQYKGWIDNQI